MKQTTLTASLLLAFFTMSAAISVAQMDINSMMQNHAMGGTHGMKVVEDTSPYVPNEFVGSFTLELHSFQGGIEESNSPNNIDVVSSVDKSVMRMDKAKAGSNVNVLTDHKEKFQYVLMTDEKGKKMAIKTKKMKIVMSDSTMNKTPNFKVTSETKTIDGHKCTKIISKTDEGTWTGWVAKDIKAPLADMMRTMHGAASADMAQKMKGMDGFPLEFEYESAKEPKRMVGHIRNLKLGEVDQSNFSIEGYEVMEMPMMPFGK